VALCSLKKRKRKLQQKKEGKKKMNIIADITIINFVKENFVISGDMV